MHGSLEIIGIIGKPLGLAGGLACPLAAGLGAIQLPLDVAMVRQEEDVTMPAWPFSDEHHDPLPPGHESAPTAANYGRK
jgi:hypothetical protein